MTDQPSPPSPPAAVPAQRNEKDQKSSYADEYRFVAHVRHVCQESPGARAALRSGLGKAVDDCTRMHWVIADLVPETDRRYEMTERAYYTIAAMIASAPEHSEKSTAAQTTAEQNKSRRNFGECLADAVQDGLIRENSAEARLRLLTKQSTGGLHRHLPSSVRIVGGRFEIADWVRLLVDLRSWDVDRPRITRRWLQSFYRARLRTARDAADAADIAEHATGPAQ
ncbi:type I-E CRISPR-associated protein Cse2/CasB [Streptomyces sp. NPDC058067]|uniref:type I-E CRISPR-associated protein Cse2/CasB n=1 Tax=Streptomyces sp. NPDC058067 TaxID=3346324 RepID=UPI0036EE1340